jgi:hypothetical protein
MQGKTAMEQVARARRIVLGLFLLHLALHPFALVLGYDIYPQLALYLMVPAQGTLLGFWIAMGGRKTMPWRACAALGIVVAAVLGRGSLHPSPMPEHASLLSDGVVLAAATMLVLRVVGLRLTHVAAPEAPRSPLQVSILEILSWTTAAAVMLGVWQSVPEAAMQIFPSGWDDMLLLSFAFTILAATSLWLVFGETPLIARGLAFAVLLGPLSFFVCQLAGAPQIGRVVFILSVYSAWVIASLVVVRLAGYRVGWRRRGLRQEVASRNASEAGGDGQPQPRVERCHVAVS